MSQVHLKNGPYPAPWGHKVCKFLELLVTWKAPQHNCPPLPLFLHTPAKWPKVYQTNQCGYATPTANCITVWNRGGRKSLLPANCRREQQQQNPTWLHCDDQLISYTAYRAGGLDACQSLMKEEDWVRKVFYSLCPLLLSTGKCQWCQRKWLLALLPFPLGLGWGVLFSSILQEALILVYKVNSSWHISCYIRFGQLGK